jgi:hypothetical protein
MKSLNPNNSGRKLLVEECQKIAISSYLREANDGLRAALISSKLKMEDVSVSLTTSKTVFGGLRYWFKCPICARRAGTLFLHPVTSQIGCRTCLGLEYRSRRYKGMIECELKIK